MAQAMRPALGPASRNRAAEMLSRAASAVAWSAGAEVEAEATMTTRTATMTRDGKLRLAVELRGSKLSPSGTISDNSIVAIPNQPSIV